MNLGLHVSHLKNMVNEKLIFIIISVGGVDPKSPSGTAAAFSKANKAALKLANTSLLFEFASNEILNQLTYVLIYEGDLGSSRPDTENTIFFGLSFFIF